MQKRALRKERGRAVSLPNCKHGRLPDRGSHAQHETVPVVSRLRQGGEEAALAALAPLPLWCGAGATRPVFRLSGCLS